MSGVIRKKQTGEAWETVADTGGGGSTFPPTGWTVGANGELTIQLGAALSLEYAANGDLTLQLAPGTSGFRILDASGNTMLGVDDPGEPSMILGQDPASAPTLYVNGGLLSFDPNANRLNISNANGGTAAFADGSNNAIVEFGGSGVGFYGGSPASQPTIAGVLSAVVDPNVKTLITSLVAALAAFGVNLVIDGTT